MSIINKLNKSSASPLEMMDEYLNGITKNITNNCENILLTHKLEKVDENRDDVLTIHNYTDVIKYNYNISRLKLFAKYHKLKISGNKTQLITRMFVFLHLSSHIIKIQKVFRGNIQRKLNNLRGPAFKNIHLCTNNTDFITLDNLTDLPINQFFSFKDSDGFIYGFDLTSIYNLIFKSKDEKRNPYNRNIISNSVRISIQTLIRFSKMLKKNIVLEIENCQINMPEDKIIELRALSLFQNIDSLGNYSNAQWFLSLSRNNIIKFIRELIDIWNYRAQLSNEVKINICPPNGNPFINLHIHYLHIEENMNNVRKVVLEILEKIVNSGIDRDSNSLGAYYVLGALTLVNESAAIALPWLFQSVSHF